MHKLLLNKVIMVCRERVKDDGLILSPFSREQLEEAVVELDNLLIKVEPPSINVTCKPCLCGNIAKQSSIGCPVHGVT